MSLALVWNLILLLLGFIAGYAVGRIEEYENNKSSRTRSTDKL